MKKEYRYLAGWAREKNCSPEDFPNKELNELAKEGFEVESYRNHGDSCYVSFLLSREIKD